ncbi:MAG: 50S ribosomal protein L11 methyltransferase [Saprospiraceae bacterium]
MDIYWAYHLETKDDIVIALLSDIGFESFIEEEDGTIAYVNGQLINAKVANEIAKVLSDHEVTYSSEEILPRNWNALWEASFTPVTIDDYCIIRADFHKPDKPYQYDIIINPKMAFGTGHHATTKMVIELMRNISFKETIVLDYGAGTGILAILSSKMGCFLVDSVDIEEESYLNMKENAEINEVNNMNAIHGTLDDVPITQNYDIILANINRNILIRSAVDLVLKLKPNGFLVLSGILEDDKNVVTESFTSQKMTLLHSLSENNWSALLLQKKSLSNFLQTN